MRTEEEIREKLEQRRKAHQTLMRKSGEKPCKPDGSADGDHIAAVSTYGEISMLEWVLEEDE